jgi:hypothetical protein
MGRAVVSLALSTIALSMFVARQAMRAPAPRPVIHHAVIGAGAGAANWIVPFFAIDGLDALRDIVDHFDVAFGMGLVGLVLGAILGGFYGCLGQRFVRIMRTPSLDDRVRTLRACGAWLRQVGFLIALLTGIVCGIGAYAGSAMVPSLVWIALASVPLAVGVCLGANAETKARERAEWLARVRKNEVRGWRVAPLAAAPPIGVPDYAGSDPAEFRGGELPPLTGLLVRVIDGEAYRTAEETVARVRG